jgi:tetratricopeptide (TPR) repeat protein
MNGQFSLKALVVVLSLFIPWGDCGGQTVDELVKQGDVFDQKYEPDEALDFYLPAEKQEPDNVSLLLRIARQYRHLMQDAARVSEKLKLGAIAKGYAERAVALAPNEAEAHLSVAISHAKMVPILGTKERLEASKKVKSSVDKSIALDPKRDQAWHILGCWHQRLADIGALKRAIAMVVYGGLPAATNEESVKCLQKAIALNPDSPMHHIELGRTYAQMGQTAEARKAIEKGLALPDMAKDDPEMKKMGRETLEKLK